ncbi:MAG: DUF3515 domain-containing protein [Gordonia sp. (in: high G+C Gram-positive bacteria)]|uniref:DUF3515 domain-containing protein n=1 Tax=Gordonia sp. (in: high G+C Gram-positive bacteria) TaxID=84139 RepID=UPI0039E6EF79
MTDESAPGGDEPGKTDDATGPASRGRTGLSPALIATLVTVPVMVLTAFLVFAVLKNNRVPESPIRSYPASSEKAETDRCAAFIEKLPASFGDYRDKEVDGNLVRWTFPDASSNEPLELRCGVARPEGLAPTSSLQVVNAVQWFITDTDETRGQAYVLVDRRPYLAMWVPAEAGNAPLTDVSDLAADLPSAPLDFGGR